MAGRERMRLTDAAVERLRPREGEFTVWDDRTPGLGVRTRPDGRKELCAGWCEIRRALEADLARSGLDSGALKRRGRECHRAAGQTRSLEKPDRATDVPRPVVPGICRGSSGRGRISTRYKPSTTRKTYLALLDEPPAPRLRCRNRSIALPPRSSGAGSTRSAGPPQVNANHAAWPCPPADHEPRTSRSGHVDGNPAAGHPGRTAGRATHTVPVAGGDRPPSCKALDGQHQGRRRTGSRPTSSGCYC